jgi:hypothetical protein
MTATFHLGAGLGAPAVDSKPEPPLGGVTIYADLPDHSAAGYGGARHTYLKFEFTNI